MSDFIFSSRRCPPGELKRILERWLGPVSSDIAEYDGAWGSLAVARAPHDPEPTVQDNRGITVLIGEPMARLEGRAPGRAAEGERRAELHRLLLDEKRAGWDDRLDGPFAALAIDTAGEHGMVVTDLFAWITVFSREPHGAGEARVIGTHVDAVAEAAGVRGEVDPIAAVELMGYFTIAWPRTLYTPVSQVPPGSTRRFEVGKKARVESYWKPHEETAFPSLAEAATALRSALVEDVRLATEGHRRVGMLMSGGEDARVVLGAVPRGVQVEGFVYAEMDNREIRSARRIARAYGASLQFGQRPPGHDMLYFETVAAMVGTQNEFIDVHGYGLHRSMGIDALPVVLGGYSSDALLKGDNVRRWARRKLQRGQAPGIRSAKPPTLPGVREDLLREAAERRTAFRRWMEEL
ncbi:MAG TPA: asparagine synthase-related protein, partial [Longimicrobium sp.]|nr:asparagine synthase-related protein [Longimicrobium sp.]